jgi:two-component system chemotaxis sensor kinase CheA
VNTDPSLRLFFEESAELLRDFEEGLLRLEQEPDDREVLNRVFRSAHTLKGNSGMLGFEAIARFTHVLESLLAKVRGGTLVASGPVVTTLLASADVIRDLLEQAREHGGGEVPGFAESLRELETLADAGPALRPRPPRAVAGREEGAATVYQIRFRPPRDLLRRGLDFVRILDALEEMGELEEVERDLRALPPLADLDPEAAYLGFACRLRTRQSLARVQGCFEFVGEDAAVQIDTVAAMAVPESPAAGVEDGDALPGSFVTRRGAEGSEAVRAADGATIRVPTEKVDRLINLVGELVITQSMVARALADFTPERLGELREAVAQMDRHARDLQERVMAVRMLPIRTVLGRFPRVVRDLALSRGKQVVVETSGEETELDKSVIELMSDPLTHLVRNAVDHGIELPEVRRQAGKPEVGRLTLSAYQQGGNIYIEVADDGGGLDRDRILARAIQAELVAPDQPLADEQVFALIFLPGFSTAETITEVSGRGVGMDVVKRNLEALGGSITIRSEHGRGTTFRIKLPLTLAILDGQSVRVGPHTYIVPLLSIIESVRPRSENLSRVFGAGEVITIRGEVLPMLRLHRMFGVMATVEDPTQGLVVIVEHEGRKIALLVDELLGQQQVVIKSLETNFRKMEGIAGATILGDGQVALIVDVPGLVALGLGRPRHADRSRAGSAGGEARALVGAAR